MPYFLAYRRWREDGLDAVRTALDREQDVIAVTLDIRNYYHRIDPSFMIDERMHRAIGLSGDASLTDVEVEFTEILIDILLAWEAVVAQLVGVCPSVKSAAMGRPVGGLPIGVAACRVMVSLPRFCGHPEKVG